MNNELDYSKKVINNALEGIKTEVAQYGMTGDRLTVRASEDQLNYLYFLRDEINRQIKAVRSEAKKAQKSL